MAQNIEATFFVPMKVVGKQTTANNHFNWQEAKEMEKSGLIDFQSYTYSHCNMSYLNKNKLLLEITKSFETIENHLGEKSRQVCNDVGVDFQITELATRTHQNSAASTFTTT